MTHPPIMVVEDDADLREALVDTLELAGYTTVGAIDGEDALRRLANTPVGLVVSDVQMHPMDGFRLLQAIKRDYPYLPVLLMTAYGMIDKAVQAMRAGACNYLTKPFEPEVLLAEVARYVQPVGGGGDVVAEDSASVELLALARRVAVTPATVLINGESGTGKEVLAHYIHRQSPRAEKPFVAINCAAIPENLLESILFGHEKGSFTGAAQAQAGKFEQAQEGTLLLDEISEMPLALQAKLLRVLQEREVERLGGRRPIPLDVRVISTSNRDMRAEVAAGRFREDLYYRLNVFPLRTPALRERPGDILPLARYFLARFSQAIGRPGMAFAESAEHALMAYGWPGNIRELENLVQRAAILATGSVVEAAQIDLPAADFAAPMAESPVDIKSLTRVHVMEVLDSVNGSRKLAAQRLGISERTLRYRLQQYREEGAAEDGGNA